MKNINNNSIHRAALLSLLSVSLNLITVHAQSPQKPESNNIENTDPFKKDSGRVDSNAKSETAEMISAQAATLFARGEKEKAIQLQKLAIEKANDTVVKLSETLAKYEDRPSNDLLTRKMREIIIPRIAFQDVSVDEAVDFLRMRSIELDTTEPDANKKGVNILITQVDAGAEGNTKSPNIKQLDLKNISLGDTLKYICESTNMTYKIDGNAVVLSPKTKP